MDGWLELVFDGGSVGSVVDELAVLAAFVVVLGAIARRRLRRAVVG